MDKIGILIKRLLLKEPFYAFFLMGLLKVKSNKVSIAGVSLEGLNYTLHINDEFFELEESQQLAVLLHETYHICLGHCLWNWNDKLRANIAMDEFINQDIKNKGYTLPDWSIFPEHFNHEEGLSSKEYYDLLENDSKIDFIRAKLDSTKVKWEHDWKIFDGKNKELIKNQLDYQLKKTAKHCRSQGHNIPKELENYINSLFIKYKPAYDWKKLFRNFIYGNIKPYKKSTKKKPNKRFEEAKGRKLKYKPTCVIYLDGSGSMSKEDYLKAFSQIKHLNKVINFYICHFDSFVSEPYLYKGESVLPKSNGGTNFSNVRKHFNESNYNMGLIITDGFAEQINKLNKPFMWLITTEKGYKKCVNQPGLKIRI